jgi:hypothetical protein
LQITLQVSASNNSPNIAERLAQSEAGLVQIASRSLANVTVTIAP